MTRKAGRIRTEPLIAFGIPLNGSGIVLPNLGSQWFVNGPHTGQFGRGDSFDHPLATIQAAHDAAAAGDLILVAPGEYDEDVTVTKSRLTIIGCGPRHSVRVTGVAAGTATAMTLSGVQDVGLYNLNMEGRSGGFGLEISGAIRRADVRGCKIHGGDDALRIDGLTSQVVDVRIEDNVIANAADGIVITATGGGDPTNQVFIKNNLIQRITADMVKTIGFAVDLTIQDNVFAAVNGVEPTTFLDIDDVSTTGIVCGNRFHDTIFDVAKIALAAGVLFVGNYTETEGPSINAATLGGTAGRPN